MVGVAETERVWHGRAIARVVIAGAAATCYVFVFFVSRAPDVLGRVAAAPRQRVLHWVTWLAEQVGAGFADGRYVRLSLYYAVIACVIPWTMVALSGRWRLRDVGWRWPNALGWRVVLVGLVLSLPFLWWMAQGGMMGGYVSQYRRDRVGFVLFYLVNMFGEHFLLHGALLGALRPDGRWPARVPASHGAPAAERWRSLRWLGMAQPVAGARRMRRVTQWFGLPVGCVAAMVVSAGLFCLVHVGKDPRELVLSLPGGFALAYAAYRTNTFVVPLVLHVLTAGVTFWMILLLAGA